ncbi:hypothetical protein WJX73_002279 [Symbiochloris irregularis]|uniref:Acetyl-CoA carboxylase n=1 Tax=Symbiochloris irregularis TaxID=706552 RepID=A0AAW1NLU3_9CHLO
MGLPKREATLRSSLEAKCFELDQFVEVPGGSNNNNYANVPLIVQVAERANVDAVWPGWGHASEKPELPAALLQLRSNTAFLGPPKGPMAALGDKIGSTILAQTANVPTIPWSGSAVTLDPNCTGSEIPADIYKQACIHSADQAVSCCQDIGFPVMLKASWGGGGKGIRRCLNEDDVQLAFKQVQGEVPGSPIFAMKLASTSRHVEVQLLCDEHGNCCSLFSRDCSVQRRHQKIIEEGPVTKASQETLQEMEMRARALARSVGYVGAATVEYLYDLNTDQYYFLELNPRLQVEHPVTEWISQVNIPACQLMIGMGIPLWRIPDIRRLYGKELYDTTSPIDFEQDPQLPPSGHVVAFGHIFAKGTNREGAIRALVVALKEIKIRGEIRTIVDYAIEMIQSPEFLGNSIHTGWLDYRVASQIKAEQPAWHLGVIAGALLRTLDAVACRSADYLGAVDVVARKLNDGGLLIQVDGESHVVHSEEEALGTRLTIDGLTCLLANETDSSKLLAVSPGKLIRYLVDNGSHVSKDQAFAEIEVMKMMMLLMAPADGNEVTPCTGGFPEMGPPVVHSLEIHYNFKAAFAAAENVLQGYEHSVDAVVTDLLTCLDNPALALMQWHEAFSVAETRLPGDLKALLSDCMAVYEESLFSLSSAGSESEDSNTPHTPGSSTPLPAFPSEHVLAVMHHEIQEYARSVIKELFDAFLRVEERFAGKLESTDQEVIDSMRTEYSSNLGEVVDIVQRCLLTYISRVYFPFIVREPEVGCTDGIVWAVWLHTPHRTSSSRSCLHLGLALLLPSLAALPDALNSVEDILCQSAVGDTERGTLHVIVTNTLGRPGLCSPSDSATSVKVDAVLLPQVFMLSCPALFEIGYSSLSVMITRGAQLPMRVGLWRQGEGGFSVDPLMSSVEPMSANVLELERLAGGGRSIHHCSSRDRQCHIYLVIEGSDTRSPLKRVFTRMVLRQLSRPALLVATYKGDAAGMATAAMEEVEKPLALCLQELEGLSLTSGDPSLKPDWAHVFISVLPPLPLGQVKEEARIVLALKAACAGIMSRYGPALRRAQVAQVEVRMRVADNSGAWRMVVSSPSGHEVGEENVEIYRESVTEPVQYISKHTKYEEQGALHGMSVHASYPALDTLQRRRLAAKRHRTTYCYDFPSVFNTALRDIWTARSASGEPGSMPSGRLVEAEELVMAPEGTFMHPAAMTPVTRTIGSNDVGIVAWLLTMKTPECPQGRQVVAVANDITFNLGSFGPAEDAVFRSATEYALEEHLPLVYLAANSGARVGLANEVKQCLQVEWNDPADPSKGFKYLYLPDQDYQAIWKGADHPWIKAKPITVQGEDRWIIKHVVGREDGLGVECLSGSGAIASAYAKAFREGLTITYVSSRTVGIGAYLARLGRRCIQRADQPIILTGYSALNKLLGREVYSSQLQLGGPKVMGVNGVSHQTVTDDLDGATAVLKWLGTMPPVVGVPPSPLPSSDPVERAIGYCPGPNEKLNPRAAIAGREATDSEPWLSGLFDRGTWQESHAGWAQSVVTGRARLGGIAVGIVATETSSTMLSIPADPGAPDTSERNIAQSGQVWYPNSALKTAHAIEEFDREGLPLIILANWRGFSGGQRDLFDGVLQAGSLIVESLRTYQQPIMVYMPPGAELRGGAWVVIDGQINAHQVEMYADSSARGGVLEPEAIVEIKFRTPDLIKAMHRLDPELKRMMAGTGGSQDVAAIKQREAALLPIYRQVAVAFAEMHDTPIRMVAKGVLHGIVPWSRARPFLAIRLRRRLAEEEIVKHITTTDAGINRLEALEQFRSWMSSSTLEARAWSDDRAFLEWVDGAGAYIIANELKAVRIRAACRAVSELTSSAEGREGLLQGLKSALTGDGALRAQLASVLHKTMRHHEPINGIPEAATPRRYRRPYAEPMKPSSLLEQADLEQPIQPIISNLL